MTGPRTFAAIDIGASSGRVVAGLVSENAITIEVVHRFANGMHAHDGHLRWNLSGLHAEVLVGLSGSTPGRWTTGCWTPTGGCWPSRSRTATTGPTQ
jgi:hypothetical protein